MGLLDIVGGFLETAINAKLDELEANSDRIADDITSKIDRSADTFCDAFGADREDVDNVILNVLDGIEGAVDKFSDFVDKL